MPDADPNEFIHPIIQAMQFAAQRADAQRQAIANQQNQQIEQDQRQQQLDEVKKQHADEFDQKQQELDATHQLNSAHLRGLQLQEQEFLRNFFKEGGIAHQQQQQNAPGQGFIPTVTNPTQTPSFDVGGIPVSPEQIQAYSHLNEADFNRQYGQFKQQKDYEEGLAETQNAQKAALERETNAQRANLEFANQSQVLQQNNINTLARDQNNYKNQRDLEDMKGGFQLASQRIAHDQGTEDLAPVIKDAFDGVINGQTDYSKLPPLVKKGVDSLAGATGFTLPTDRKDFSTKVNTAANTDAILKQAQDLALKYSRDGSESSGGVTGYVGNLIGQHVPGTDLKSALDSFKTNGGSLVKAYEGMNRSSDADILRQSLGTFDPTATVKENLAKIEARRVLLNGVVKRTFAGMPDAQVKYILGSNGLTSLGDTTGSTTPATVDLRKKYQY